MANPCALRRSRKNSALKVKNVESRSRRPLATKCEHSGAGVDRASRFRPRLRRPATRDQAVWQFHVALGEGLTRAALRLITRAPASTLSIMASARSSAVALGIPPLPSVSSEKMGAAAARIGDWHDLLHLAVGP